MIGHIDSTDTANIKVETNQRLRTPAEFLVLEIHQVATVEQGTIERAADAGNHADEGILGKRDPVALYHTLTKLSVLLKGLGLGGARIAEVAEDVVCFHVIIIACFGGWRGKGSPLC